MYQLTSRFSVIFYLSFASINMSGGDYVIFPKPGIGTELSIFGGSSFGLLAKINSVADATYAFSNNSGTRLHVIGAGGTISVLDRTAGYQEVARYSLGSPVSDVTITPDGSKLLVLAGELRIIDLSVDRPATVPFINVGALPNSVAVSMDSTRAYVTNSSSRTIFAIDLSRNNVLSQLTLTTTPNAVRVGSNGLIYVAGLNRLYEIDGLNGLTFTQQDGYVFDGNADTPAFTPDGQRVVMLNQAPGGVNGIISVDLKSRSITTAPFLPGIPLTDLKVVNNTTAYALGNGRPYVISIAPATSPALALLGVGDGISGLAVSNEVPNVRYLFANNAINAMRADLRNGPAAGPFSLSSGGKNVHVPIVSSQPVGSLLNATLDIPVAPNATTQPIVVQAVDNDGVPAANAMIQFATISPAVTLLQNQALTNAQGFATIRAKVASVAGNYSITATGISGGSVNIPIRVSPAVDAGQQFTIVAGNGQIVNAGSLSQPFQVKVTDSLGDPIANASVNWGVKSGIGLAIVGSSSTTNSDGIATVLVTTNSFTPTLVDYVRPFTISGTVATGAFAGNLDLQGVIYPIPAQPPVVELTNNLPVTGGEILLPAGTVIPKAFTARVLSGLTIAPVKPVPNVGIRAYTPGSSVPLAACRANPVSDISGIVSCDLIIGPNVTSSTLGIIIGESTALSYSYPVRVIPGTPSKILLIQGDGQAGSPGSVISQALVIEVQDAQGNSLNGATVAWSILSGDASLQNPRETTDLSGRASTLVKFGTAPGPITVKAATGGLSVTFNLFNGSIANTLVIVDGSGQASPVKTNFALPLRVKAVSPNGDPISGVTVAFQVVSGPVSLPNTTSVTNAQGIASVDVSAGETPGAASVTAQFSGSSVTFNLTVTEAGPRIDSILNGASFREGIAACSVAVVKGSGFTQGLNGVLLAGNDVIPVLAYSLKGVSVQVNGIGSPLYYISNIEGVEQIGIQIPCELTNGPNTVSVTALGQTTTKAITISDIAPGVFETEFTPGVKQGVVVKADGSYVGPTNPAVQGETLTGFFTGLMPTSQPRITNAVGVGQPADTSRIIIGLNNAGMPVVSAQYAPNMIGVYAVKFVVDQSAGSGDKQAYAIGVIDATGNTVYGNSSTLPIR